MADLGSGPTGPGRPGTGGSTHPTGPAGPGPGQPKPPASPPPPTKAAPMTALGLRTADVDTHRVDLRDGRRLLAYAVADNYGWVLMARRRGQRHPEQFVRMDPRRGESPGLLRMLVHRQLYALVADRQVAP